jgi:uncharacterized membrane protein YccC
MTSVLNSGPRGASAKDVRGPSAWERFEGADIAFGLRTAAAALFALWLAMTWQLDTPRWAAWTAISLALPTRGIVAAKGLWRAAGTLLGVGAGTAAVALFAQSPVAMGLALSLWFAINAYVGGRLPGLASYGAALSGLTAGLVVILAAPAPLSIFALAMARGADILLGIACVYAVSAIAEGLQGPPPAPAASPVAPVTKSQVTGNALRAFVVVGVAWAFWMATAWPSGGIFVVFAGVVAIFFATMPDPDLRARAYLWGVALGQGLGIFVKYTLLDGPASFGWLATILAPFIFMGAVGVTDPRTAAAAIGYNLSFLLAVDPANPMQYDLLFSLNETTAIFAGIAFGVLGYRIIFPERIWRAAR